jgi:transcriptional regulator with XRE-family HTH domain
LKRRSTEAAKALRISGERIASLRRSAGLSQAELAELAGLHYNTVSSIEKGRCDPSVVAFSLIQVRLGSPGIELSREDFAAIEPDGRGLPRPFEEPELAPPYIVAFMGGQVRRRRLELGISQGELAASAGVHLNTVWNFERGLVAPSTTTVWSIYRSLGIRRVTRDSEGIVLS